MKKGKPDLTTAQWASIIVGRKFPAGPDNLAPSLSSLSFLTLYHASSCLLLSSHDDLLLVPKTPQACFCFYP